MEIMCNEGVEIGRVREGEGGEGEVGEGEEKEGRGRRGRGEADGRRNGGEEEKA